MNNKITLRLSDGSELTLNSRSVIQPISLRTVNDDEFTSEGEPIILEDHFHPSAGYTPIITEILAKNNFFMILDDLSSANKPDVFQSCNVVKISHN